jgi:hypothetical protein
MFLFTQARIISSRWQGDNNGAENAIDDFSACLGALSVYGFLMPPILG